MRWWVKLIPSLSGFIVVFCSIDTVINWILYWYASVEKIPLIRLNAPNRFREHSTMEYRQKKEKRNSSWGWKMRKSWRTRVFFYFSWTAWFSPFSIFGHGYDFQWKSLCFSTVQWIEYIWRWRRRRCSILHSGSSSDFNLTQGEWTERFNSSPSLSISPSPLNLRPHTFSLTLPFILHNNLYQTLHNLIPVLNSFLSFLPPTFLSSIFTYSLLLPLSQNYKNVSSLINSFYVSRFPN